MMLQNLVKEITPWPRSKYKKPEFDLDWRYYKDHVVWIPGKLYLTTSTVLANNFLPRKTVNAFGNFQFDFTIDFLMEEYDLTKEEALSSYCSVLVSPGSTFMLVGEYFDGFIFSILFEGKIKYVSRQELNNKRCIKLIDLVT